jgi:S-adenosylmethionine decarboxylase
VAANDVYDYAVPEVHELVPYGYADPALMFSYALDVRVDDPAILVDEVRLLAIMRGAAEHGQAVVLGECVHVFPNGAVTAVLLLSQSHLSVHTWPEHRAANFDLLTCGRLNGEQMISYLERELEPVHANTCKIVRDLA